MARGDDPIADAHRSAQAQFQKVSESFAHLSSLRGELDHLSSLGDMISPEDVVKSAANLVGKGFSAHEMAVLLSEMPDNTEALKGWIAQNDQMVTQWEQNAKLMMDSARHQLGVTALHVLMKDHLAGAGAAPQMGMSPQGPPVGPAAAPPSMALSPSTPTAGNA